MAYKKMKKTYIYPELKVEQAEPSVFFAISVTVDREGSVDANEVETKGVSNTEFDVWDDEW